MSTEIEVLLLWVNSGSLHEKPEQTTRCIILHCDDLCFGLEYVVGRLTWMTPTRVVSTTATWTLLASRASTSRMRDVLEPLAGIKNIESGASLTATPPIIRLITAKVPVNNTHTNYFASLI